MSADNTEARTRSHTPKGAYRDTADPGYAEVRDRCEAAIGIALRQIMDARGVTAADVGKIMGLSPAAVRHRLYGARKMTAGEVIGLAMKLDFDPRYLLDPTFTEQD